MKKHLNYSQDGSDKFWEIEVSGKSHTVRYGRRGTAGRVQTRKFSTPEKALQDAQKQIDSKLKKGYKQKRAHSSQAKDIPKEYPVEENGSDGLSVNAVQTQKFKKEKLKDYVHPYVRDTEPHNLHAGDLANGTLVFDPAVPGRVAYFKELSSDYEHVFLQTPDGQLFTRKFDYDLKLAVNPLDSLQREYYNKTNLRTEFRVKAAGSLKFEPMNIKNVSKYMQHPSGENNNEKVTVYDILHPCLNLVDARDKSKGQDGFGRFYRKAERTWLSYRYDFKDGFVDSLNKDGIDFDTRAHAIIKKAQKQIHALFHEIQKHPHFGHELLADEYTVHDQDGKEWRRETSIHDFPNQCKIYPKYIEMQMRRDALYEGVWHIEGLPQEHVLMSLLYYEDVSHLETRVNFKRLYNQPELEYVFRNSQQDMHHQIRAKHEPGYVPLGHLDLAPQELYLFPNSCAHRVQAFQNEKGETATRRFWAFFIVDPRYADVVPDPSTASPGDIVSYGESNYEAELIANMKARQGFKSKYGDEQPEIAFCEH